MASEGVWSGFSVSDSTRSEEADLVEVEIGVRDLEEAGRGADTPLLQVGLRPSTHQTVQIPVEVALLEARTSWHHGVRQRGDPGSG